MWCCAMGLLKNGSSCGLLGDMRDGCCCDEAQPKLSDEYVVRKCDREFVDTSGSIAISV